MPLKTRQLLIILAFAIFFSCNRNNASNETQEANIAEPDSLAASAGKFKTGDQFKIEFNNFYTDYLSLSKAFVAADPQNIKQANDQIKKSLSAMDVTEFDGAAKDSLITVSTEIEIALREIASTEDLEKQRTAFSTVSNQLYKLIRDFGLTDLKAYYTYCPMAFNDQGAYWISDREEIRNPYFGDKMLTCGVVKEELN